MARLSLLLALSVVLLRVLCNLPVHQLRVLIANHGTLDESIHALIFLNGLSSGYECLVVLRGDPTIATAGNLARALSIST